MAAVEQPQRDLYFLRLIRLAKRVRRVLTEQDCRRIGSHLVHDVVLAHVLDHLQAEIILRPHLRDGGMIDL